MKHMDISEFSKKAEEAVLEAARSGEAVTIATQDGNAVLINAKDYKALMKSLSLTSIPLTDAEIMEYQEPSQSDMLDELSAEEGQW